MTDVLSISDFFTEWERHFGVPVHPFAARLLAPVQQVWLKPYDDEDTLWCVSADSLSFVVGFVLERDGDGISTWSVHLPSNVFARTKLPRTHFWLHQGPLPGSDRVSTYAGLGAVPERQPFCTLEAEWKQDGRIVVSALLGGQGCG